MKCVVCSIHELRGKQKLYCSRPCERKGWRDKNRDKILAGKRRYREANRERISAYLKMYKSSVKHVDERIAKRLKAEHPCLRCGTRKSLEVHHIKHQLYGGGKDDLNNLVVLCKPCHALWHRFFDITYWSYGLK